MTTGFLPQRGNYRNLLVYRRRQELNGANGTEGTDWANE